MPYTVRDSLKPSGLAGISEEQIAQHWKLYEGYVGQTNTLLDELAALRREGKGGTPGYADRRRRLGFEMDGMVLHEYYFGNLRAGAPGPDGGGPLQAALAEAFGSFEAFREDFLKTGGTRSIGWAVLYLDPATGFLNNHFVQVHEDGHVAGFAPLLVLDVWEHAYMVDHGAGGRGDYMKAFWGNVDWPVVEKRFREAREGVVSARF